MRFKNLCVYIDITDGARPKFRARCFCFNGKTEVAWGRTIAAYPRLDRVRLEIEKFFRGKRLVFSSATIHWWIVWTKCWSLSCSRMTHGGLR